jgi:hypothetical protein
MHWMCIFQHPVSTRIRRAALLFLYQPILHVKLPRLDEIVMAKKGERLSVVLTPSEVRDLLFHT